MGDLWRCSVLSLRLSTIWVFWWRNSRLHLCLSTKEGDLWRNAGWGSGLSTDLAILWRNCYLDLGLSTFRAFWWRGFVAGALGGVFWEAYLEARFWEAPPPEYMGSGGYRSGAAGGSAWGRPRSRLLPFVEMLLLLFVSKTLYVSLFVHV